MGHRGSRLREDKKRKGRKEEKCKLGKGRGREKSLPFSLESGRQIELGGAGSAVSFSRGIQRRVRTTKAILAYCEPVRPMNPKGRQFRLHYVMGTIDRVGNGVCHTWQGSGARDWVWGRPPPAATCTHLLEASMFLNHTLLSVNIQLCLSAAEVEWNGCVMTVYNTDTALKWTCGQPESLAIFCSAAFHRSLGQSSLLQTTYVAFSFCVLPKVLSLQLGRFSLSDFVREWS